MTDDPTTDDIRKQVEERVKAEAAQLPQAPAGSAKEITGKLIRDCLFMNELGDGTLYATIFRDRFLYCNNSDEWYEWEGHHWQRDIMNRSLMAVEAVVEQYLTEYSRVGKDIADAVSAGEDAKSQKLIRLRELHDNLVKRAIALRGDRRRTTCLKFAHTIEPPLAITGEEFDCHPWLFPCANGVIDLKTGLLDPGRPSDYLTKASPIAFTGIDTPCHLWEKTLLEIFNGSQDLVDYLRRLLGYSMTGLVSEKVFPVLYGKTGWNGRSMIIETVRKVMGDFAHAIPSEMLLSQKFGRSSSGPSPDIMSLRGIRLAFASEIDENQSFSVARIKGLTGKDELVGRNPHDKHPTNFYPTHKLFLMTNTQPEAPAGDKAFWYRMALIPFDISFVNRDPQEPHERRADLNLDRKIIDEASGILAWLVRGCLEWQRDGLAPPREVTEATEKYRRSEDLIADWIYERAEISDPNAEETATNLYKDFVDWYHDNIGQKERTGTWFGKQLGKKYEKHKSNGRVLYLGISLKNSPPGGQGEM
jgi:putative DNA primase/helicase